MVIPELGGVIVELEKTKEQRDALVITNSSLSQNNAYLIGEIGKKEKEMKRAIKDVEEHLGAEKRRNQVLTAQIEELKAELKTTRTKGS